MWGILLTDDDDDDDEVNKGDLDLPLGEVTNSDLWGGMATWGCCG